MAWIYLFIAGLLETGWATALKYTANKPGIALIATTGLLIVGSMLTLALAMRTLPLGVAYPIWTGIGSVGSVAVSVALFRQTLDFTTVAGVFCLILGMVLIGAKSH